MSDLFSMNGKNVLITGAYGGIGKAIVESFAEANARLALIGTKIEKLESLCKEITGARTLPLAVNICDITAVKKAVMDVKNELGSIDVLINAAGINIRKHFLKIEETDYDTVMNVNVKGLYFLSQEVCKVMADQRYGKVINFASLNTFISLSTVSIYAASKGAVGQITKAMAVDMARYNVQVNAIAPGFIKTPFNELLWGNKDKKQWIEERTLTKRFGLPEDLVGTMRFLSSKASDFITGQIIVVDGGFLTGSDTLFG